MNNEKLLDLYDTYLTVEKQYSPNTKISYLRDIRQFITLIEKNLIDVDEDDALKYYTYLRENYNNNSLLRKLSSVKNLYKYFCSESILEVNPFLYVKSSKKQVTLPKFLSIDEINTFLDSLDGEKHIDFRNRAMFELLYATGIRVSELITLEVSNINLLEGFVLVTGKGNKQRIVPIGSTAISHCEIYINSHRIHMLKEHNNTLFLNAFGKPLTRQGVYKILKEKTTAIGIYDVSPHKFRHSIATHLLNGGANMKIIQEILGHSDISTVQIYAHVSNEKVKNEYNKYHPLSKKN